MPHAVIKSASVSMHISSRASQGPTVLVPNLEPFLDSIHSLPTLNTIQEPADLISSIQPQHISTAACSVDPPNETTHQPTTINTNNMRFLTIAATALAVAQGAFAVEAQKAIIMSFPQSTPDDVISRAMDDIRKAGGTITHEYKLLKGFAAKAPQKIIETVTAWSTEYKATIEEDQIVEISNPTTN
ncbi:hypothetical protein F4808DRAFT_420583, partial [Astrocystis sublimbata]